MNKAKLKSYAPQARKDFIAAVTARANLLGLSEKAGKLEVAPSQPQGDATVIAGQAWPIKVHSQRQQLIGRIQKDGFAQTMEAVAYTWFNRFAALRYMELHDYLGHGHRALSSLEGSLPDILTHAADLAQSGPGEGGLPGLKPELVVEMKLAGNRDGELYRLLLVAQCNALSNVMPFLFERIDDETELLLPDNLLRTDSVVAKLVNAIDEEDWGQVEIIGWLYQFYISEKKDEVIGKVVRSEDIPAATQLFTPNWIVQYLVQNSVGRLWLMSNPASALRAKWPYYIAPADQTLEVQAQLDALIQARVSEDGDSLNPESITLLDPACGSGHILVEAYEVLKAIYLERGYQPRAIPRLILEKNLYGLDIDDRAAQMAGFALLMKARADDRRLFNEPVRLNVFSLQESKGMNSQELTRALLGSFGNGEHISGADREHSASSQEDMEASVSSLICTFANAKNLGSLIRVSRQLKVHLAIVAPLLQNALQSGDLYAKAAAQDLLPLVAQASVLGMQFDAVAANPPYMGGKGMNSELRDFAKTIFPDSKADLFAMFMERGFEWCKPTGFNGMVTMQSWMFLSSYESMRANMLRTKTLSTMVHMGNGVMGIAFGTTATVLWNKHLDEYVGSFSYCENSDITNDDIPREFPVQNGRLKNCRLDNFKKIPGSPIVFWIPEIVRDIFFNFPTFESLAKPRQGMASTNNALFVRAWYEVAASKTNFFATSERNAVESQKKWFPYDKGGEYRKWFGNNDFLVNFENGGEAVCAYIDNTPGAKVGSNGRVINRDKYFKEGITWSAISSGRLSVRYTDAGHIFSNGGSKSFNDDKGDLLVDLGFLNSEVANYLLSCISQTVNFNQGVIAKLPLTRPSGSGDLVKKLIDVAKCDWNALETSWGFLMSPLMPDAETSLATALSGSWSSWDGVCKERILISRQLEEENNRLFINAYGLQGELNPEVPESQITLARADREKDSQRLISYAIGCMMGRYNLDEPGLIYAGAGNVGFDATRYIRFPADADGIVPLTDELWFEDEAASRIREFLRAVWGADTLTENMAWLAESLGIKASETPDETIRRYLADKFYKDHLQTYKKRPIYWLFSSGKQGAFQALVYLHRYHEGTLSRMRAEYVVPLTGKIQSRIDMLEKDAAAASSTAARNKLGKEVDKLKKKHVELLAYDEQLRHHADMRITLDLDDGVKVNYGKFGDLLAEVKVVTGGGSDD